MQDKTPTDGMFDPAFLQALAARAGDDAFVHRRSTFADLRIGLQCEDGARAVLVVDGPAIRVDPDAGGADFVFQGDASAFDALRGGMPFNRLVRQHRLQITGDLRSCVQNWLLIYAIFRLIGKV